MNVIYLTSDLASAHTAKRVKWFELNDFRCELLGSANKSNIDVFMKRDVFFFQSGFKGYLNRVIFAFFLVLKERKKLGNSVLIVRGFEYVFFLWLFRIHFFKEITDIPPSFFKYKPLLYFYKSILSNRMVFLTSGGYNEILNLSKKNVFIWHNNPVIKQNKEITNRLNKKILYAGYLRGLNELTEKLGSHEIDLWGKLNILTQNYNSAFVSLNYKGTYLFEELSDLYGQYQFSYVSDFYDENSNYNLTNRLYESILNYCIPIEVNHNFQKRFLDKVGISYLNSSNMINLFDRNTYIENSQKNFILITKEIQNSDKKIVDVLRKKH